MSLRIPELTIASQGFSAGFAYPRIAVDEVKFPSIADEFIQGDEKSKIALNYFFSLKEVWQLTKEEQEALLRDNDVCYPIQPNMNTRLSKETQQRIGILLEIWGLLHQIYGANSAGANKWVKKAPPAKMFNGRMALDVMSESDESLKAVASFLREKMERLS